MPTYPDGLTPTTDQVRAMLGPGIGVTEVPDSLLALRGDIDYALRWAYAADPYLATRTSDDLITLQRAVALVAAARIAPFIPSVLREADDTGHDVQWSATDWVAMAGILMSQATDLLTSITQPATIQGLRPTLFTVAKGRRRGY